MINDESGKLPLPSNFIVYDHNKPSLLFPTDWVAYIESISADFDEEDLRRIRAFERFALNINTGLVGNGGIPGLRKDLGRGHTYVRRFSEKPWEQLISDFDSFIPATFPERNRYLIDMIRISTFDGGIFYPFTYFGDLGAWRRLMAEAADRCGTVLAEFDRGSFAVSDGHSYKLSQLSMVWNPPGHPIPVDW